MVQVVSAFTGCGKSMFRKSYPQVLDSDASQFDKRYFVDTYLAHIRNNLVNGKCTLVSTHDVICDAMRDNRIPFILVYPDPRLKGEYLDRYTQRGSEPAFIQLIEDNWDRWIGDCQGRAGCKHVVLQSGQYLSDVIGYDSVNNELEITDQAQCFVPVSPKHRNEFIAVDFDGTIVTNDFPDIGKDTGAIAVLKALRAKGTKLILYTVREGKELQEALGYCAKHGIDFTWVNENLDFPNVIAATDKPYADVYIDDKAMGCPLRYNPQVHAEPYVDWTQVRHLLQKRGAL